MYVGNSTLFETFNTVSTTNNFLETYLFLRWSRGQQTLKFPVRFLFLSCIMVVSGVLGVGVRTGVALVLQNGQWDQGWWWHWAVWCGQHCREGILDRLEKWDPANLMKPQQGQVKGPVHGPGQSLSKCYWSVLACMASEVVPEALFPPVPEAQMCEIQPSE